MNKSKNFDSFSISASAGCGKTYKMAIRMLGMFLSDVENPEKIFNSSIAMTFSRSGAKEIYNRILELIFDALFKNEIESLNNDLKQLEFIVPDADREMLLKLLRKLIFAVNDLKICTIDSFMSKIVTSYSTELGLPRKIELTGASEENILKNDVLKTMLLSPGSRQNRSEDEIRDIAMESKKNSYGRASRTYLEDINQSVNNCRRIVDDFPDVTACQFAPAAVKKLFPADEIQNAWNVLKNIEIDSRYDTCKERYNMLQKVSGASVDTFFNSAELNTMRKYFAVRDGGSIPKIKKTEFNDDEYSALQKLLSYAACILLHQSCVRSEAALNLYRNYQQFYADTFYAKGKITFADLPRLLSNKDNDWTYDIAYRLNNKFAHFLIDEFQDTSRLQWHVLSSIFDTNPGNDGRSMFIVGDVKQAIYGWRSGDRRLMGQVTDQLNLTPEPLDLSFRYGKNICTALNHIFDGKSMCQANFFPGTAEAWANIFKPHTQSDTLKYRSLFEAYLCDKSINKSEVADAYAQVILAKIKEYKIIEEQKSCAILVSTAANGTALLDILKNDPVYGRYFMWEGNNKIANDTLITVLLHLLIYIQHPADTMAKAIVEMLPAAKFLLPSSAAEQCRELSYLNQEGFYKYLKNCILKLKEKTGIEWTPSPKDRESIELFLRNADKFDRSSISKDAILFKKYIAEVALSQEAIGYKIRIMTIHHSKGLTFDHVFTALFNNKKTCIINDYEKNIPIAGKSSDGQTWMLNSVNVEMLVFPEIREAWNIKTVEDIFGEFCAHYVALSRAKYTMTLLLPNITTKKNHFADYLAGKLFKENFAVKTQNFDTFNFNSVKIDDEYKDLPVCKAKNAVSPEKSTIPANVFVPQETKSLSRRRIRPSDGSTIGENNGKKQLFFNLPDTGKGKDFGIEIHEFLCTVKDFSKLTFPAGADAKLRSEVEKLLKSPDIISVLQDFDECFNELSFDVILGDSYVSGCFDRVQIRKDADGKITRAVIVDYKSGKYDSSSEEKRIKYHAQLNLYRKALSQLLLLDIGKIECYIIATENALTEKVNP